jgi:hypothetical protein
MKSAVVQGLSKKMLSFNCICLLKYMANIVAGVNEHSTLGNMKVKWKHSQYVYHQQPEQSVVIFRNSALLQSVHVY